MLYPVTPRLSVPAVHLSWMPKAEVGAAVSPDGAVGGVASTVQLAVAASGSTTLLTVAATEKVWAFWGRPV